MFSSELNCIQYKAHAICIFLPCHPVQHWEKNLKLNYYSFSGMVVSSLFCYFKKISQKCSFNIGTIVWILFIFNDVSRYSLWALLNLRTTNTNHKSKWNNEMKIITILSPLHSMLISYGSSFLSNSNFNSFSLSYTFFHCRSGSRSLYPSPAYAPPL